MDKPWSRKQLETEILVQLFQSYKTFLIKFEHKLESWIHIYSGFIVFKGYLTINSVLDLSGPFLTILSAFQAI